jgi:peptidoglycan/LPS O-acetylase OafA/YrhL
MQLLGKSSYIFYLLHIGVIANFTKEWTWVGIDKMFNWMYENGMDWFPEHVNDTLLYIGIVFIVLNLISIVLYKGIEEPVNLAIRKSRLLEKRK